jgi:hypothetical protein
LARRIGRIAAGLADRNCKGIVGAIDDFDFGRLNVGLTALTRTEKIEFFGFVLPKLSS